ncbi:hypothetical protein AnigIFM60653_000338 [Aspergillus niger]|nr:hypothetical protein AnigIFM50267_000119 [Aspergillus niger]GKZ98993.1 hypothetical protein AnigIFM60653_000338 [Aspergillus niger]
MQFRYSTGTSNPFTFPWEAGIPNTPFWDTFSFSQAASKNTTSTRATAPQQANQRKWPLSSTSLQEKIKYEEARYTLPDNFHNTDHTLYRRFWLAVASVSVALGQTDKAEAAYRTLVTNREDKNDLVPVFNLSGFLIHYGTTSKVQEGLGLTGPCLEWLDKKLGRASPQGIEVMGNIAEAEWKMGRREEAEGMIKEAHECIDELKGTKFAVYEDDEREFTQEWEKGLRE